MPAAERSAAAYRRFLHHDEPRTLEVLDQALGDDRRHELVGVVRALPALKASGERQGIGDVVGCGGPIMQICMIV